MTTLITYSFFFGGGGGGGGGDECGAGINVSTLLMLTLFSSQDKNAQYLPKISLTLSGWYSLESSHCVLSDVYHLHVLQSHFLAFSPPLYRPNLQTLIRCHVAIHWKDLVQHFQMSTHMPGFHSFFSFLRIYFFYRIGPQ